MTARYGRFSSLGSIVGCISMLMFSGKAVAQQDSDNAASAAVAGVFIILALGFALVCYVYMALALQTIAAKTATPDGWLAWIPIANAVLMLNIAKKPLWWIILFLIPLVNIVIAVIVWMGIAEARNKPNWWGILTVVPVANLIVPGYLAWAD